MEIEKYDIVIIGSGPGGFAAAMRALDFKKSVCIVEAQHIGGTGIMNGALTSKTMWELSQDYAIAANVSRGYRSSGLVVDYSEVRKTVVQAAKDKQYQILSQIETFSKGEIGEGRITLKYGRAKFLSREEISIESNGEVEKIAGTHFIIATGSRPRKIPNIETDEKRILTSDGILNLKKFPERMIIIGSGIIGCEFAAIFSNFKQTEVHLLDRYPKVVPYEDPDVSDFVSKELEHNGVTIHHTAALREIRKKKNHMEVILDYQDGHSKVIEVDVALISIGRTPNTKNLGLENINVRPLPNGFLDINDTCNTDNQEDCNIYAVGDVTGSSQLYSVAEQQGRYVINGLFEKPAIPRDFSNMPALMFFKPAVASVGMNEKMLQNKKIPYRAAFYSNKLVNRNIAMRNTSGFVKILVSDSKEDKILGVRAAGPQASAFIVGIAHLINEGNKVEEIMKTLYPHPSVTEGVKECFRVIHSESIFKPKAFPDLIKSWKWAPGDPEIKDNILKE